MQTVRLFPSLQNSILGFSSSITVEQVVSQTNEERSKHGLKPLTLNSRLSAAALAKGQDMLDNQYWSHTSPEGKQPWDFMRAANYRYRVAGENLARDFHHTTDMISAWMASPTHKANIINDQYEQIGIAVIDGKLEGFDTTLVVQMFGAPTAQTAAVSDSAAETSEAEVKAVESQPQQQVEPQDSEPMHNPLQAVEQEAPVIDEAADEEPSEQELSSTDVTTPQSAQRDSQPGVLASALIPIGHIKESPLFTPLQLTKIFFLGIILIIVLTLSYDSFVIGNKKTMRLVGQNLGHIILFTCVAFLMILFKGGMIK